MKVFFDVTSLTFIGHNLFQKNYALSLVFCSSLQNFSSIVGPNGSGKSNVIDAMLFVFGYRSKMIRTKKVSQLIHNSENHQNVQSCTVSVHFQKIIDLVSWASFHDSQMAKICTTHMNVCIKKDSTWSELLEARLALASVNYHRNVEVSMLFNEWFA